MQLRDRLRATNRTSACCLLHAGFLVGFDHEDGSDISPETSIDFHETTRRYIPEDTTLYEQEEKSGRVMEAKAILSVSCACLWAMSLYFDPARVQGHGFVTPKVTYTYQLNGTADKLLKVQSIRQADMSQHCTISTRQFLLW
jgi:hypothetical protein